MRPSVVRLARRQVLSIRQQHTSAASSSRRVAEQTSRTPLFRFSEGSRSHADESWTLSKVQDTLRTVVGYPDAHIALRDACKCSRCIDQSTRQREFDFADIPANIQGEATQNADGNWQVTWTNDIPTFTDHVSIFTPEQIQNLKRSPKLSPIRLWDKQTFSNETSTVTYNDFISSETGLAKTLYLLARHGLVFINNIPRSETSITTLATRIAPLRNTFYGQTWNVKSIPSSKNVAYTHKHLGFHMDLMYLRESPEFQLLHCLDNSCVGGESRFIDTFKAFDTLLSENKEAGTDLMKSRIRYEYNNDNHYYSDVKPIISLSQPHSSTPRRRIRGHQNYTLEHLSRIYWSPPFVGSIWAEPGEQPDLTRRKLQASKAFADILERPELIYEEKMEPGTCMIFNNTRVLHARNAFDVNSGERWLKGCYIDGQDVASKEMGLGKEVERLDREMNRLVGSVGRVTGKSS